MIRAAHVAMALRLVLLSLVTRSSQSLIVLIQVYPKQKRPLPPAVVRLSVRLPWRVVVPESRVSPRLSVRGERRAAAVRPRARPPAAERAAETARLSLGTRSRVGGGVTEGATAPPSDQ
jgi:hypothetical protein